MWFLRKPIASGVTKLIKPLSQPHSCHILATAYHTCQILGQQSHTFLDPRHRWSGGEERFSSEMAQSETDPSVRLASSHSTPYYLLCGVFFSPSVDSLSPKASVLQMNRNHTESRNYRRKLSCAWRLAISLCVYAGLVGDPELVNPSQTLDVGVAVLNPASSRQLRVASRLSIMAQDVLLSQQVTRLKVLLFHLLHVV